MTRTNIALLDHAEQTHTDARAVESHVNKLLTWGHWPSNIEDIRAEHINRWIREMEAGVYEKPGEAPKSLSPSTIQTRLSVLKKAMQRAGVAWPVDVKMPQRSKRPKWVLPVEDQNRLVLDLTGNLDHFTEDLTLSMLQPRHRVLMAYYIVVVTETGLRVEEALRIERKHLITLNGKALLEVMGTKTAGSYDLIPLSERAQGALAHLATQTPKGPLFTFTYEQLRDLWKVCLEYLKVTDETATLKSLRRTFAARLAARGIPTTILQKLMRHASLVTTSHYTNAIGMHEAAREWLN